MKIVDPKPQYSTLEKEIISLICEELLGQGEYDGNQAPSRRVLTDKEADKLVGLLKEYLNSRQFLEANAVADGVFGSDPCDNIDARKLYFKNVGSSSKAIVFSKHRWAGILSRMGFGDFGYISASVEPMSFKHFLMMERRLFSYFDVSLPVLGLMHDFLRAQGSIFDNLQSGEPQRPGIVRRAITDKIISPIASGWREVPAVKLAACAVIVIDGTVQFTTRDWSAASMWSQYVSSLAVLAK